MPLFQRDNIEFHYLARGKGVPVIFQHGLGGDAAGILGLLELPHGYRLVAMDFRGHGQTKPLGDLERIGFNSFADDLIAFLDELQLPSAVVGGTSMGAGVALNCALRHPQRLEGLVLLRPAWLDGPNPQNVQVFGSIARLIRERGPEAGLELFQQSALYKSIAAESNDSAESLLAQFRHPRAVETVAKLERIPQDCPNSDRTEWRRIAVPTLVLANRCDPIHPFEFGQILSQEIPGAQFKELNPKSVNLARYIQEVRTHLADFLLRVASMNRSQTLRPEGAT